MKILNLLLAVVFALFALAQYNDSDGWTWIIVYLFVAVTSFFAFRGDYNKGILALAMILMLGWMALLLPGFIDWINEGMPSIVDEMKANAPHIESTREFLGLFLAFITLIFHFFQARKFD